MSHPHRLRVWWIPQLTSEPFHVPVDTADQAVDILRVLADYDRFQCENRIKPDYCNAGGLEVLEDGEWAEWDNGEGVDINEIARNRP